MKTSIGILDEYTQEKEYIDFLRQRRQEEERFTKKFSRDEFTLTRISDYDKEIAERERILAQVEAIVEACPDALLKYILKAHYLQGINWDQVADKTGYSLPQIYRYRKKALAYFNNQMEGEQHGL